MHAAPRVERAAAAPRTGGRSARPRIARPIAVAARIARSGSCHQCGSSPSRPAAAPTSTTSRSSTPARVERAVEPLVRLAARAQHHVGLRQRLHVARAHLVLVRVGVGLQDRRDLRVRRDVARDVGELRRRRDHPRPTASRANPTPPAGGEHEQRQEDEASASPRAAYRNSFPFYERPKEDSPSLGCAQDRVHGPNTLRSRPCCVRSLRWTSPAAKFWDSAWSRSARCGSPPPRRPRRHGPRLFELALPHVPPPRGVARHAGLRRRRARFDLVGLRWARGHAPGAGPRAHPRRALDALDRRCPHPHGADVTAPIPPSPAPPTSCSCGSAATRSGLKARFVRALPHAPQHRASAHAAQPARPRSSRARGWGADQVPPRSRAELRRRCRPRSSITPSSAIDYAPEESAGHRARNRPLPPRFQRLERHRVQLPRRPLRRGLRGPRGRHRGGRDRRPGAGLEQLLDRDRLPRDVHRASRSTTPAMESLAKLIGWKLSLHGVPVAGPGHADSGGGESNRYRSRHAGASSSASAATATAARPPARATRSTRQLPDLRARAARYVAPGLGDHGQAPPARRAPSRRASPASCASPTAPRPPGAPLGDRVHDRRARPGRQVTTTSLRRRRQLGDQRPAARQRQGPRGVRRRRHPPRGWSRRRSRSRSCRA